MRDDLISLVPDANLEHALRGIYDRTESLGIRRFDFVIQRHYQRDPGCFKEGPDFLRYAHKRYRHAMIVMDYQGSGQERDMSPDQMERDLRDRMSRSGWKGRCEAIVIDPELENWVWSGSPHVSRILGWRNSKVSLGDWLRSGSMLAAGKAKPEKPKEALEAVLWETRTPRSSAIYSQLAKRVSLKSCTDPAFVRLKATLKKWFRGRASVTGHIVHRHDAG